MHRVALPLLLLLLPGCLEGAPPSGSAVVEPAALGDSVNVTLTLHVEDRFTYTDYGGGSTWHATVFNGTQAVTELYAYGVGHPLGPAVVEDVTLEPGTYPTTYHWNGRTVAHGDTGEPHDGPRVPPGTYTIRADWKGFVSTRTTTSVLVTAPS